MYRVLKRCFDFTSALLLFLIISPLFIVLTILVRIEMGPPVFFTQLRSGLHQKTFRIIKFRSMTNDKDSDGKMLPDEERQSKFGSFLRSSSLDELPELLLIIKGDMSVIGPRPLPPEYNEFFTERERKRFDVRGGLIPPEVLYNDVCPTWDNQLEYEADYAEKLSMKLDIKILFTVFKGLFTRAKIDYGDYVRRSLNEERTKVDVSTFM